MPWKHLEVDAYDVMIPLYYQVQRLLLDQMFKRLQPGDMLPSEKELCLIFKVSRSTMRQALEYLVKEGYIERFKGRGTFLKKKPLLVQSLEGQRSVPTINFAVPGSHSPGVVSKAIRILDSKALQEGYLVTFTNLNHDMEALEIHLRAMLESRSVSGVIYFPLVEEGDEHKNERVLAMYREADVPFVIIDRLPIAAPVLAHTSLDNVVSLFTSEDYDFVLPDNLQGGYSATRHLLQLGHRRVALVSRSLSHASYLREQGYRKAMRERGIGEEEQMVVRHSSLLTEDDLPVQIIKELRGRGVTAVFAEFDLIARALLQACAALGVRVPDEFSVVGYDDLDFCEYLEVPLTTIRQPVETEVKMAVDILFQKIRSSSVILRHVILPVDLVERRSTAAPAAGARGTV